MADHFAYSQTGTRAACGRDYRDIVGGKKHFTTDRTAVTCRACQRTDRYRYPSMVFCGNEWDHRPRAAVAQLSWPDGRFKPTTACTSCLRATVRASVDGSHGTLHPVLVSPLPEASHD